MYKPDYMLEHPQKADTLITEQLSAHEDNQQEIRLAAARFAMMVDTDGWATIFVVQRSKVRYANLNPQVGVLNTNPALIGWADNALTLMGVPHYVKWYDLSGYKNSRNRKPMGRITVQGIRRLQKLMPQITPYLIGKAVQGKLLDEYITLALQRPDKSTYTQRELEIANEIRQLNSNKADNWRPVSSETVRQARELTKHLRSLKIQSDLYGDIQNEAEMSSSIQ